MASQGDAQTWQVSGEEGVDQTWSWALSLNILDLLPGLGIRVSPLPPHQPHLLQAQLSHITEGGEAKLGEVVLVALETNGRKPGLGRVQARKGQGHRVQKSLGRPKVGEGASKTGFFFVLLSLLNFLFGLHLPSLAVPGSSPKLQTCPQGPLQPGGYLACVSSCQMRPRAGQSEADGNGPSAKCLTSVGGVQ